MKNKDQIRWASESGDHFTSREWWATLFSEENGQGTSLDLDITTDGDLGIPLDRIDKYFGSAGARSIRFKIPERFSLQLWNNNFFQGVPTRVFGRGIVTLQNIPLTWSVNK